MFSSRVPSSLTPNRLAARVAQARRDNRPLIDLTESNPTRAGISYPVDLLAPLADPRGLVYAPEPLGLSSARAAVAADYARRGLSVPAEHIVLAASTSDAYSLAFKVLCEPGDEVLVPRPSYPLFEYLTRLDSVVPITYDLEYHGAWSVDFSSVERAVTPRTRVILTVNPNNPTGHFLSPAELDRMAALCRTADIAIVSDEVFADYPLVDSGRTCGDLARRTDVLGFTLGGLSKSVGLPQVKLAWMALSGPRVDEALARLEWACDTYLSVSTPVQAAAADLLARGADIRSQIHARTRTNYRLLETRAAVAPSCRVLATDGGWYAVVHVPTLMSEEDLVLSLLDEDVLVHPGYFFDFTRESFLVLSLLTPETPFAEGIERVFRRFDGEAA